MYQISYHDFAANLIGKGGCNNVYKGTLEDGKQVAVKIRKSSSPEAKEDFVKEVEIMSSLKNKNTWDLRFSIAVKVAEALNYLHNDASRPVIHRDVKSANILLSDGLEPQLSDFGMAMWAPTASAFVTQPDVVGTFGYLAPEYFMYGKVSDKIDVYAFGVVLLELISGREPIITSKDSKAQQSLVMWAKRIMQSGNSNHLLDPTLDGNFNEVQFQRMVTAAKLCITLSARLRPKMSEILELLTDESEVTKWAAIPRKDQEDDENEDCDDEVYPNSSPQLHLNMALLDTEEEEDSNNGSSGKNGSCHFSWEDYLKGRWSRSPM
ncbi:Protein kinase STUNTED [Linum perenne]